MIFFVVLHVDTCPPGLFPTLKPFTPDTNKHNLPPDFLFPQIIPQCSAKKIEYSGDFVSEMWRKWIIPLQNGISNLTGGRSKTVKNNLFKFPLSETENGPRWMSIHTLNLLSVILALFQPGFYFTAKMRLITEFTARAAAMYSVCWRQSFHFTCPCNVWWATEPG